MQSAMLAHHVVAKANPNREITKLRDRVKQLTGQIIVSEEEKN